MKKSQFPYQPLRGGVGQQCVVYERECFIDTGGGGAEGVGWALKYFNSKNKEYLVLLLCTMCYLPK